MPQNGPDFAELEQALSATELPSPPVGLHLLAVSHDQFQACWNLEQSLLARGQRASSRNPSETQLVLRAFNLTRDAQGSEKSNSWTDYAIDGIEGKGYFAVAGSIPKVSASLGLVNRSGQFTPLLSSEAIHLPVDPSLVVSDPETEPTLSEQEKTLTKPAEKPADTQQDFEAHIGEEDLIAQPRQRPAVVEHLSEEEITSRLEELEGLPRPLSTLPDKATLVPTDSPDSAESKDTMTSALENRVNPSEQLDEKEVLKAVWQNLANDPDPEITESIADSASSRDEGNESQDAKDENEGKHSETLASQWEELWSDKAPVAIEAIFVLTGRIQPGTSLLLGHEIIKAQPGGTFIWKKKLNHFSQAWSLIESTLHMPSIPAAPTMQFFLEHATQQRLLEMQAALEISGRVTDPSYTEKLPEALELAADGTFKSSCLLPYGSVILPGLSLVADSN